MKPGTYRNVSRDEMHCTVFMFNHWWIDTYNATIMFCGHQNQHIMCRKSQIHKKLIIKYVCSAVGNKDF